jgi:hypothetical protein
VRVVSEGGLEPHPYGNSPRKLSGPTDTSVALANIPKGEYARGWTRGADRKTPWGAVQDRTATLTLAR